MTFKEYGAKARAMAHDVYPFVPAGMEIDHIYSIHDGWLHKVPLEVISHPANLQLLPRKMNRQKSDSSWITLDELHRRIEKHEKSH